MTSSTLTRAERQAAKKASPDHVGAVKTFGWSSRGFALAANFVVLGYFTLYATDALGMPPALVGGLLLASKVFDGFTDLLAGYVVDRTRTRWGRARPYEWAIIGVWISTWLLFSVPELGILGKAVWIFVAYTFVNSIFATLCYANQTLYMARAFGTRQAYAKLNAAQGLIITVGVMALSIALPQGLAWAGKDPSRWSSMALFLALPMCVIGMGRFFFVKEVRETEEGLEKIKWTDIKAALSSNRWIWILGGVAVLVNFPLNTGANSYYFTYIVGDIGLLSIVAFVGILALPTILLFPWLMKRIHLSRIILIGQVFAIVGAVINTIAWDSVPLLSLAMFVGGIGALPMSYMVGVLLIDCATYNEWQGHRRLESTLSAIHSFATKVGQGIALAAAGLVLGAAGYDGTAEVQSESAISAIHALYTWVPGIIAFIVLVLMYFYKLDGMLPQINQDLAERKADREAHDAVVEEGTPTFSAPTAVPAATLEALEDAFAGDSPDETEPTKE